MLEVDPDREWPVEGILLRLLEAEAAEVVNAIGDDNPEEIIPGCVEAGEIGDIKPPQSAAAEASITFLDNVEGLAVG